MTPKQEGNLNVMVPTSPPLVESVSELVWAHSTARARALLVLMAIARRADRSACTELIRYKDLATEARVAPHEVERLVNKLAQMRQLRITGAARGARSYEITVARG